MLVKVSACGVCHTELDEIEGRTPPPRLPVILGHQVVGIVQEKGRGDTPSDRAACRGGLDLRCLRGVTSARLALKISAVIQGHRSGCRWGYAEYMVVPEKSAYSLPDCFTDSQAAPLLCAGAIGYRSLRLTGLEDGQKLGLTGFGASGHLVLNMVRHKYPEHKSIRVRPEPATERDFARELGAAWAGDTADESPAKARSDHRHHAGLETGGGGPKEPETGGRLVINAIRKEEADKECC